MEIDIFDYVSKEEIKEEILSGIRYKAMNMSEDDFKRVMTNAFYGTANQIADEIVKEQGYEFDLRKQIKKIISEISTFTVFREATAWEKPNNNQLLLEKIVQEESELVRNKVVETFDKAFSEYKANQDIAQIMSDYVYEIFSIKKDQQDGNPS